MLQESVSVSINICNINMIETHVIGYQVTATPLQVNMVQLVS